MLNEQAARQLNDLLAGMTKPSAESAVEPAASPTGNTFQGTGNVNIVCQTLVIGSLHELVAAATKKP